MSEDGTLDILHDATARLFADRVTKERIIAAEAGAWLDDLWVEIANLGLDRPHRLAESGRGWREAYVIIRATGRWSVPLPIPETILASWLLAVARIDVPEGPLTIVSLPSSAGVESVRIPWGRFARAAVGLRRSEAGVEVELIDLDGAEFVTGTNLAREPRDRLSLVNKVVIQRGHLPWLPPEIDAFGALIRAGAMAGALDSLLEQSVQYARERVQFGRPIAQFQAIQQELAKLAGWVAAGDVAARTAFDAVDDWDPSEEGSAPWLGIAAAKVVLGEAAEVGPRIAHQIHGAIGFTYEHTLHFATRRLWSWRAEFGGAQRWATWLGRTAYAAGAERVWPMVTARSASRPR